jgi:hypothetical protein
MTNTLSEILSALPWTVIATLCLFLACLLAGWLGSIIAGFRSAQGKGLRLLLLFPLTNPFALLILLFRHRWAASFPLLCYGVAVFSLPVGGFVSERVEKHRLERHVQAMERRGESLSVASLRSAPIPAEENVWAHPFLEPLAKAGQRGAEGEAARASLPEQYQALSMPRYQLDVRYADEATRGSRETTFMDTFRAFHQNALWTELGQEKLEHGQVPDSWEECGEWLLEHFRSADEAFDALGEALDRPRAQYPHSWEQGFDLLLPHLSKLKAFTQCATWRAIARNSHGESEAALRDVSMAMSLIELDDSDLLISRLVQWAQAAITLNALMVGQQYHAWTAEEWATLQSALEAMDFPGQVPDSMRAERVLGHATIHPLLSQHPLEMRRSLDRLGAAPPESGVWNVGPGHRVGMVTGIMVGGLARAFLASQWRLALEAYQELIAAVESAVEKSRIEAWKDLRVAELPKPIERYGFLARMLMPALDRAFKKSLDIQAQIRLAIVACALEQYFMAHDRYPDSIEALSPDFLDLPPLDPMTRQPWFYERTGARTFRLYSAGRNGVDEGGLYTRGALPGGAPRKDDLAWVITEQLPPLPEIVVDPPEVGLEDGMQLPAEIMRRYGLSPSNPADPAPVTNRADPE